MPFLALAPAFFFDLEADFFRPALAFTFRLLTLTALRTERFAVFAAARLRATLVLVLDFGRALALALGFGLAFALGLDFNLVLALAAVFAAGAGAADTSIVVAGDGGVAGGGSATAGCTSAFSAWTANIAPCGSAS